MPKPFAPHYYKSFLASVLDPNVKTYTTMNTREHEFGKTIETCVRTYWPWIIFDSWYVVIRLIFFYYTILLEVLFEFQASQALLIRTFVYATFLFQIYNVCIFLHLGYHIGGGGGGCGGEPYNPCMNLKESEQVKGSQLD